MIVRHFSFTVNCADYPLLLFNLKKHPKRTAVSRATKGQAGYPPVDGLFPKEFGTEDGDEAPKVEFCCVAGNNYCWELLKNNERQDGGRTVQQMRTHTAAKK